MTSTNRTSKDLAVRTDTAPASTAAYLSVTDGTHLYELRGDRIVRDRKETAVLVSPGFGAGFTSDWNADVSPFEPKVVLAVLAGRNDLLADSRAVATELGLDHVNTSGTERLTVEWVPLGTRFRVDEYDGSEYIVTENDLNHTA